MSIVVFPPQSGAASIADATDTTAGKIRIATSGESTAGTNTVTAMTPALVQAKINAAVSGGVEYKGSFNAATASPSLVTALKGDLYLVSHAGTFAGIALNVNDHIVFNQNAADPVTSSMFDVIDNTSDTSLQKANNLSDLNSASTARTNLGLGDAATKTVGVANGNVIVADATGLPVIDGSQLTGVTGTDATKLAIANNLSDLNSASTARTNLGLGTAATSASTDFLAVSNNLSDLNNAGTARTNLGLGDAATKTVGVGNGNVIVADATGLPVIDGSQLTGVTGTDATKLAIANNLSDLNNVGTARTNLGLGTAATSASTDFLAVSNNLSDLNNAGTARTNLGLGDAATKTVGVANGNVIVADATGLPVIDGSQLTGVTGTDATKLAIANNLSDLNSASTARTNLGLGDAATKTVGVANGNVIVADATGLPVIDGSQLTGITATDATKLAIANNLSDLNNAGTARTNLGLGDAATKTVGVANGNVIVADATGLPVIDGSQLTGITASVKLNSIATGDAASELKTTVGNITINASANDADIIFEGNDGGSPITMLTLDGSEDGDATFKRDVKLAGDLVLTGSAKSIEFESGEVKITHKNNAGLTIEMGAEEGANEPIIEFKSTFDGSGAALDFLNTGITTGTPLLNRLRARTGTGTTDIRSQIDTLYTQSTGVARLRFFAHDGTTNDNLLMEIDGADNSVDIKGSFQLAGTAVTATASEINLLDGGTTVGGSITIADADGFIINDNGTMKTIPASDVKTYAGGGASKPAVTASTSNTYTITTYTGIEEVFLMSPTGTATITLTAAATVGAGYKYNIKLLTAQTLTVTRAGSDTIDGATTFAISAQYGAVTLMSDGSNWHII